MFRRMIAPLVPWLALACTAPASRSTSSALPNAAAATLDSIRLERTLCYGTCPAYRLHLDREGRVRFLSLNPGDSGRIAQDSISPEALLFLQREAERIGFFALPDSLNGTPLCADWATDHSTATVTVFRRDGVNASSTTTAASTASIIPCSRSWRGYVPSSTPSMALPARADGSGRRSAAERAALGDHHLIDMHRDTAILHAGYRRNDDDGPFLNGPQFSSTYTARGEPSAHQLTYGRFQNPTWTAWEDALGVLEGGHAIAFASGMAAIAAVLGTTLKPGDIVVLPSDSYYTTRLLAASWLEQIGVNVRLVPTRDNAQADALDGARLLWVETPTNPQLDVCSIRHLVAAAAAKGTLVAVDNTTATAYLQQPLSLGATYVVASDTKALTGHSDLVLGHVATTSAERATALRTWRTQHGGIPGPMEVWLAHRSLATLPLRLGQQCRSAQQLATLLSTRRDVVAVRYPGLSSHPGHAIAREQMTAFAPS